MSYRKLSDQALAAAAALGELDVRPDGRVLIMLPDGPDFAEAFAGVIQQGAVPLPVNPPLPAHDLVAVAAEAGARLVLASADQIHVAFVVAFARDQQRSGVATPGWRPAHTAGAVTADQWVDDLESERAERHWGFEFLRSGYS
jgi:acyl-CoA synthetase (AMP-forming)/AMP-acid ligase II